MDLQDAIGEVLHAQELDYAKGIFSQSGESLILQTNFLYMVKRVDACIDSPNVRTRSFHSLSFPTYTLPYDPL